MKKIPFCKDCVYYGGRKNGMGVCNYMGETRVMAHIKSDHWCINGQKRNEVNDETMEYINNLYTIVPAERS